MNRSNSKYQKPPIRDRLQYKFDNLMAKGGVGILAALLVLIAITMLFMFSLRVIIGNIFPDETLQGISNMLWRVFMQITDAGGIVEDTESSFLNKLVGIISIFIGLIFFSALVAFISNQFSIKAESLRKGKSAVFEKGHTLVLGFGIQIVDIIKQLIIASYPHGKSSIVIFSETDTHFKLDTE